MITDFIYFNLVFIPARDDRLYNYVIANDVITLGHKRTDEPFFLNPFIETNCPKEPVRGKELDFPSLVWMNSAVVIISAFSCVCAISAMDHGNCSPEWQKYVWCESQCIEKTSSGGEQTEDYRLDSLQIATDYLLTSADFYLHLAFAIYK